MSIQIVLHERYLNHSVAEPYLAKNVQHLKVLNLQVCSGHKTQTTTIQY